MIRKWLLAAAAILGLAPSPPVYSDTVVSGGRVVFGNDFFVNPAGPQGPTVHFKRPGNAQAWTTGSVIFATGPNELGEDNTRFFWNNTTKRLGIGMQPAYELDMRTTTGSSTVLRMGAGIGGHNRIVMGEGRTGNGYAYIDMVGDTTYTDYALRLLRDLSGPNAASFLSHRGTGSFYISTDQAGYLIFRTSGIDRMAIDPNSASVGIGLLPSYNLHVKVGVDQNLIVWSNGGLRTGIGSLNNAVNAWTPLSINPAGNVYISEGGGYVGIGTATPSYKVHVEGVVYSNNGYFITQGTSANYNFYDRDLGGGNSQIYRQSGISILWDSVAGNVISYTNGGLVGINTTTPLHALDIRAPGQDTYVYVGAGRAGSNGIWVGKSRASGNGFAYLDLVGDMTYTDYGLRVIRNQTGPDTTSQILHRGLGDLQFYTVEAAPISFVTNSAGRMWISAAGNVGIGTSAPRQKLEILGPNATIAMVDTASAVNNRVWDWIATASSMQGRLIDDSYANGTVWVMASRSGMSVSTVVFPFGNVGVGTWNPSGGRLHVYSNDANGIMVSGSSKGLRMGNNPSNSFIEGVDNVGGGSTYQPLYISGANVTIGAYGGGTIYINPNGTMGIHTTRDLARLTFGSPTISDNIIHLWDDGTNRYGWGIRGGQKLDYAADNSSLTWGHMSPAGVYTQRMAIDTLGNVNVSNGQFYSGYSQLNNEALELCVNRPSDGYCYVDLHSQPGTDFNFRMFRTGGVDGSADFTNNGAGAINFYQYFGRLPLQIVGGRVVINTDLGPALSIADAGGIDSGNYGTVNITRGATDASRAHLAFIRNGNAVMQFGYFPSSNDFGIWPGGYPGETYVRLSAGGMTLGTAPVTSKKGALSIGDGTYSYNPNDGTTGWGATFLLTGLDVTSVGFHDGGCCIGWIRFTGNTFSIGNDYGWGVSTLAVGGRLTVNSGGMYVNGGTTSTGGYDFYDRTNGTWGYSALYRDNGVTNFWQSQGPGSGYHYNGNWSIASAQFGVSRLYVKSGDTTNVIVAAGDTAATRMGGQAGWGWVEAIDNVASAYRPLFLGGTHVLFGLNGAENARMDANGNWGIGYSAPGQKLAVNGNLWASSTIQTGSDFYGNNLRLAGQYVFLGGAGGDVNGAGGPLIYGDGNYLILKASGSNYNMQMREYNGGVRFEFGMNGQLIQNGYATVYADSGYVQISDTAGRKSLYLGNGTSYFRNYALNFDNPDGTNFASASGGGWRFNVDAQLSNNRRLGSYDTTGNYRNLIMLGSDNTMYVGDASYGFTQFNAGSTIHVTTTIMRVYAGSQFEVMNYNAYKNGGGSWLDNSDIRTKKEVFDYRVGLSEILRLRPVVYKHNGKYDTADNDEKYVGFVADEVRKHMPEMVGFRYAKENPDSADYTKILTIDMTALPLALVNSVKELEARIKALETPGNKPTPN